MSRPILHIHDDPAAAVGPLVLAAFKQIAEARGRCRVGLSGGATPGPLFEWLAAHVPPALSRALWITWVDERHLPVDRAAEPWWAGFPEGTNARMAFDHWLGRVEVGWVQPMLAGRDLVGDLSWFGHRFQEELDGGLDVALLGAGPDGHIASLFPGHVSLRSTGATVAITDSPKPPAGRLSLTMGVLEDVEFSLVLATGDAKAGALARALAGDSASPLGLYSPRGEYHWALDPAAAALIEH
jgi:6-phosphogluconolactonase